MASVTKFKRGRTFIQLAFLAYIAVVSIGKSLNLSWGESVHALCPLGAVESLATYLQTGTFMKHTGESNWVMMLSLFLISLVGGAIFCGWICPFGTIQEFLGKMADKLGIRRGQILPDKLDRFFRSFKYVVLLVILVQSARYFKLVFEAYDPYYTFFNIWSSDITKTAIVVLIATLVLSLFIERAYCKYFCPLGGINGIMNRINIFRLKRDTSTCINCKLCDKACPMDIKVSQEEDIKDLSCTKCLKCVDACPVNIKNNGTTLEMKGIKKNWILAPIILALFLGPIAVGKATGKFAEVDEIKSYELPEDIRGSFTLDDLVTHYGIKKEEFIKGFGLGQNYNSNLKIKELSDKGVTVDSIKNFIRYKDTILKEIPDLPKVDGALSKRTLAENITLLPAGSLKIFFPAVETTSESGAILEIKRKTMLVEIKKMVKDYDAFLDHFGIDKNEIPNATINDIESKYNAKFEDVKTYIQNNMN